MRRTGSLSGSVLKTPLSSVSEEKAMSWKEAKGQLLLGQQVRMRGWSQRHYWELDADQMIISPVYGKMCHVDSVSDEYHITSDAWELRILD